MKEGIKRIIIKLLARIETMVDREDISVEEIKSLTMSASILKDKIDNHVE